MNRYYFTIELPTVEAKTRTEALEKLNVLIQELVNQRKLTIDIDDVDENII